MSSTDDYYRIDERLPGAWSLTRVTSGGSAHDNSIYSTPADVLTALQSSTQTNFEIHLRADDAHADAELRGALQILRDAGMGNARHIYRLSEAKLARIGLTESGFDMLTIRTPYLGTAAAAVAWTSDDEISLELMVRLEGEASL